MDATERVSSSQKSFAQICAEVDPSTEEKPGYEFSNGRAFKAGRGASEPES